jgi:hypothetical protein
MGFKTTNTDIAAIKSFWEEIRQQSRAQECVEGVHFDMPPTIGTHKFSDEKNLGV